MQVPDALLLFPPPLTLLFSHILSLPRGIYLTNKHEKPLSHSLIMATTYAARRLHAPGLRNREAQFA